MKRKLLLVLMAFLPMTVLITVTSCSKDEEVVQPNDGDNNDGDNNDGDDNDGNNGQQTPEIVVTVDANGNADGGHRFTKIDETNFYIDDIKYTAVSGNLEVTGYDPAYFSGAATTISKLVYNGRTLNVTTIAKLAFSKSNVLRSIIIGKGLTSISDDAFSKCSTLTSITIPNSVTSIGSSAFEDCSGLISVTLNSNAIVSASRNYDSSMKSIFGNQVKTYIIGSDVTSIGNNAFLGCGSLTSITIPNSVTSIGNLAFYLCSSLTSITIPNSVTSIGSSAFTYCTNLTSITIPNSVTSIGGGAFYGSGLTSVTIPNSVTSTGDMAFSFCSGLKDVYCYATNPPSAYYSFENTPISSATLHVPAGSVNAYKNEYPWSDFGTIVAIQ